MFDAFLGLNYNYYRDYDPIIGRFTQVDPIGLRGGVNTYAYVLGNPANNTDPLGLQTWPGDAGPSTPRSAIPGPFDILQPGTQANNDFVRSVNRVIKKVKDVCTSDLPREACKQECADQLDRDEAECLVARAGWGKKGQAICLAKAKEFYSQCLRSCDGK